MEINELQEIVKEIVSEARRLNNLHSTEIDPPVNYSCIFTQSTEEYEEMTGLVSQLGRVIQETRSGFVYQIKPFMTETGPLSILKVRQPDPTRLERGDADFTISDYDKFKKANLGKPGWSIIKRPEMEMLELKDASFNIIAYYSNPILSKVLKLKEF